MKTSLKIGSIYKIPIKLHFTFIFILALFTYVLSVETVSILGFRIGFGDYSFLLVYKILLGALASILLFACVLFHELGHSILTKKYGFSIRSITLFIFGGSSETEEMPQDPKKEIKIAIVGPAISVSLGLAFYAVVIFVTPFTDVLVGNILFSFFSTLSFYNLILAGFNLIPAFPIDGGRILRSVLALKMDYQKATKTASSIGKGLAIGLGIFGIFFNFWLVLIAIFIYFGAYQEEKTAEISDALKGVHIEELMETDIKSVSPRITLDELYTVMKNEKTIVFPVVEDGEFVGIVTIDHLNNYNRSNWKEITVNHVMNRRVNTVNPDADAFSVFKKLMKKKINRMFVKKDGKLVGVISQQDLLKTIRFHRLNHEI